MSIRFKFAIPLIFFVILLAILWHGMSRDPNLLPSTLLDKPLPFFLAPTLHSNNLISSNQFTGKVTILNVWATWCAACQVEQPLLIDLAKNPEVQILGLDYKDQRQQAKQFLVNNGNPYKEVIFDEQGQYAMKLGVYGTPETFLIDQKGIIRYRYVGALTVDVVEKDLLPRIDQIIKGIPS